MPLRIQRHRTKGWKMPAGAVYVGRPTWWGNPYSVDMFSPEDDLVALYRRFLLETPIGIDLVREARIRLRGKNLACWCPLDQPCHADVLLELANAVDAVARAEGSDLEPSPREKAASS